ncbi:YbdD/YjiX family protein [Nocardioides marmotae]|uniref:Putative selenoprotein n=1 Tax=Nocardioides marmotae TaxID=2663857 RepID=A0A6I3JBK5_9ACTN|nr:YbdD/YjiX family protein [Nocardioides marmotae]MCR6031780.1 putative selenoprotein [Gordonia jinghuaiqii]MBC9732277.1 YbdD/YjiX family protein [Nocardioides marmotae]MTB83398.1 putative selenoprotein [Nocardioides marmotae]MTB95419.1 putative selenoprotein [Nocardioides marmotae]QKE00859.1 YbdD/YjiX family protein [Nocardioides marmotae]
MSGPRPLTPRRALDGVRWYLKEISGEARWEAYLARCTEDGTPPMTRREYERHRTDQREHNPQSRCC